MLSQSPYLARIVALFDAYKRLDESEIGRSIVLKVDRRSRKHRVIGYFQESMRPHFAFLWIRIRPVTQIELRFPSLFSDRNRNFEYLLLELAVLCREFTFVESWENNVHRERK